jgi:hypothetical protein
MREKFRNELVYKIKRQKFDKRFLKNIRQNITDFSVIHVCILIAKCGFINTYMYNRKVSKRHGKVSNISFCI